ncbi:hypothetical protein EXIGLDRAFT_286981 [Exidia glandulosa HHB12029]|uniref:Uncharacterized protein n=1 Tax=Exidia glandulosa HHB12029 TaxID=1314781 RepID=A0A165M5U8_EXIGL|nr:hypothetical protein EXIGLDRAFT_286981 [Exidia glandulosa HHB12029]
MMREANAGGSCRRGSRRPRVSRRMGSQAFEDNDAELFVSRHAQSFLRVSAEVSWQGSAYTGAVRCRMSCSPSAVTARTGRRSERTTQRWREACHAQRCGAEHAKLIGGPLRLLDASVAAKTKSGYRERRAVGGSFDSGVALAADTREDA